VKRDIALAFTPIELQEHFHRNSSLRRGRARVIVPADAGRPGVKMNPRPDLSALLKRSVHVIAAHQSATGAYPACEEFSAYHGYSWLRDGSFIAEGMSRQAQPDSASAFHDWCDQVLASRQIHVAELVARSRSGTVPDAADMLPTRFTLTGESGSEEWWDFQLDGYGTWLWAVHQHAARHRIPLERWRRGIQTACDYLVEFWNTPCYDWWEEHVDQRHGSTLGAIYAGLAACADSPALDPGRRTLVSCAAARLTTTMLTEGVSPGGYLSKWIGSSEVDASLAACIVPFGVVPVGDPLAEATLAKIETDLLAGGGVHRFTADVFFGGGQWPLLTCLLGWNHARAGRTAKAAELLAWAAAQADTDGLVPEQVDAHLLHPEHQAEWIARWGPVAKPLLWSHAMILILAAELGHTLGAHMTTLNHNPSGAGHPYAASAEQRVPVHPVAGEWLRLGVTATPDVEAVTCELTWNGGIVTRIPLRRRETARLAADQAAAAGGEGHLAEAQAAAAATADDAWETAVIVQDGHCRYRFWAEAAGQRTATEWFEFHSASWLKPNRYPQGRLTLTQHGSGRIRVSDVAWLAGPDRPHRVRFSLPLTDTEHVTGFGERYDAVDQRGLTPDSVVFEQYKGQSRHRRTYFPMPFAHVIGGDGWGFHVRTSRRVWFDVAAAQPGKLAVEAEVGSDGRLALDIFHGDPTTVLTGFLDHAGRAEPLPEWVHRLWASSNEWNTQELVMAHMDAHRDHGVPVGAVVIEAWSDEEGMTIFRDAQYTVREDGGPHAGSDFAYPADGAWPDPKGMIDHLHDRGINVILWQVPLLNSPTTFAAEHQSHHGSQVIADGNAMVAAGLEIKEADGTPYLNRGWWFPGALMPDLSTSEGRDWWAAHRRYLVRDLGIDGFKTDGGEHAWGADLRYNDGTRGDDGNNLNPVRYAQTYADLLRSEGKPPVTFSRSGYTGSGSQGAFWAGDEDSTWEAFRASIRAGITVSACGIVYWGWDLAGFSGPLPGPELYLRAAAASVFMPIMQYHSEFNHHRPPLRDRTPWNIAAQFGDPDVIPDFRALVHLRERLVPYLAAQARRAIETDKPLMRALFFDHPHDPEIWHYPLQWQLGDAFLISPVTEEAASVHTAYLPDGTTWVDVWTGQIHSGGTTVTHPTPTRTSIPVYCRHDRWAELRQIFD
jgi:alpha-glucosidase (family GH31 glycosyl hydrolase)